jgi:hypothetical protein
MHLVGPYMTTTVYSRKKSKIKKKTAKQIQSELNHEKFLRKHGVHADQRKESHEARSPFRLERTSHNSYVGGSNSPGTTVTTTDSIPVGVAAKPVPNVYSGEQQLIGIATMHKSNMVPVFSKKNAVELARMRRG